MTDALSLAVVCFAWASKGAILHSPARRNEIRSSLHPRQARDRVRDPRRTFIPVAMAKAVMLLVASGRRSPPQMPAADDSCGSISPRALGG